MRLTGNIFPKRYYIAAHMGIVVIGIWAILVILMLMIAFYTAHVAPAIIAIVFLIFMGIYILEIKYLRYTYEINEQGVYLNDHKGFIKKQILWDDVTHVQEYPFLVRRGWWYSEIHEKYILILSNGKVFESESIFKAIKQDDVICIPKTIDAVRVLCEYLKPL